MENNLGLVESRAGGVYKLLIYLTPQQDTRHPGRIRQDTDTETPHYPGKKMLFSNQTETRVHAARAQDT